MAARYNREDSHGATWEIDITCSGFDGAPLDVSDHQVFYALTRRAVAEIELNSTDNAAQVVKLDAAAGQVRIIVKPADQAAIAAGVVHLEEIWTVAPDGTVFDQAYGAVHVRKTPFA